MGQFPYVDLRRRPDGTVRPRFKPGPRERDLGFAAQDLKHSDGTWFTLDEVAAFARDRHADIVAAHMTAKLNPKPAPRFNPRAIDGLLDGFGVAHLAKLTATKATEFARHAAQFEGIGLARLAELTAGKATELATYAAAIDRQLSLILDTEALKGRNP